MSVYSTAWWDLLPWRTRAEGGLHYYDVEGVRWISDGFIGFVDPSADYIDGSEIGTDGIRSLLSWERRQLVLTAEVGWDRWQAVSVLYDGDRTVNVPCGQIARLTDECPLMWLTDEFEGDDPAELAWMLAVHPADVDRSAVLIVSEDGPVAFVMPLLPREAS